MAIFISATIPEALQKPRGLQFGNLARLLDAGKHPEGGILSEHRRIAMKGLKSMMEGVKNTGRNRTLSLVLDAHMHPDSIGKGERSR